MAGQLILRTRTVVTYRRWPDGRPAVRRVAYATWRPRKQSKKKRRGRSGERDRKSDYSQRRCNGAAKGERRGREGWRWVNSGEILLVSVKDGPWSALVSWRRRGFSRASPVPNGGGGK